MLSATEKFSKNYSDSKYKIHIANNRDYYERS